jgi:hypothetical protein
VDDKLYKEALNLEYFTVGNNVFEGFFSIFFGAHAGSIALIGFGLDSIVESLSGLILIWRLSNMKYAQKMRREQAKIKP